MTKCTILPIVMSKETPPQYPFALEKLPDSKPAFKPLLIFTPFYTGNTPVIMEL